MLAARNRLRRSVDFAAVTRRGRRAGGARLVTHLLVDPDGGPPRVGFVVSRAVGGAVVRNRVTRQLRVLSRARLERLPAGSMLVVRALPPAASASSTVLGSDLDAALERLLVGRGSA